MIARLLLTLCLALAATACGIRGDPVPPPPAPERADG